MMEHGESWMDKKRWAQAGAGKHEVRSTTGKGVLGRWGGQEGAGGEGGSRLSLVIRDVQEVYQSQHGMGAARHSMYQHHVLHPQAGGRHEQPQYVRWLLDDNFNSGRAILPGVGRWEGLAHVCREQGPTRGAGTGCGQVGWGRGRGGRDARERYVPPDSPAHPAIDQLGCWAGPTVDFLIRSG